MWARPSLGLRVGLTRKRTQKPRPTAHLEPIAWRMAELNHQNLLHGWALEMPPSSLSLPKAVEVGRGVQNTFKGGVPYTQSPV